MGRSVLETPQSHHRQERAPKQFAVINLLKKWR
jgi:hypothetical protein